MEFSKHKKTHDEVRSFFPDILFIDFEASSLHQDSWPIEIGVSHIDEDLNVSTWDSLICPDPSWSEAHWSPKSASIHNISRADLFKAPSAKEIASKINGMVQGKKLLSDAPIYEHRWMKKLLESNKHKPVLFQSMEICTMAMFNGHEAALDHLYEYLSRKDTPHRAGPDSALLAKSWVKAVKTLE